MPYFFIDFLFKLEAVLSASAHDFLQVVTNKVFFLIL